MKPKQNEEILTLPLERSKPLENLGDYSMLLYGLEKIGKTTLASMFPDAFFLMCEPGGRALEIFQKPVRNWRDYLGYLRLLQKTKRFKTVVTDTVDLAFKFCEDFVCKKLAIDHPSDESYGKGWGGVRDEFSAAMVKLVGSGRGVIFVSHAQEREFKQRGGASSHRMVPTMSNQARSILEPMVDIWAFYGYDNSKRMLQIVGDDEVAAGHRLKQRFKGYSKIPMGATEEEAFANFMKAFNTTKAVEKGGGKAVVRRRVVRK